MTESSNKRIAKNTLMLYFRMLITLVISLYTSRVVLSVLGVEDYGVYNVVGGIVTLFTFLNGAMCVSTSRFLTFDLGKQDYIQLKKTFSAALSIHIAIAIIVFILAESIGLWMLYNKLVIPEGRMHAALWVYQFSILSCMVGITQVPYNASIVAHEKMNIYAYVSIIDVILKLFIVFILMWISSFDKLILYGILVFAISIISAMIYRIYCKRTFTECTYHWEWDKMLYGKMIHFSGWSLLSNFSWGMTNYGTSILLNMFFGPVVNAAQAIAIQVNTAVSNFVANFRTAVNPQIIKLYANDEKDRMFALLFQSNVYSYYILLFLVLPIVLETPFILGLWLKIVPEYTVFFVQLTLVYTLIQTFDGGFVIVLQAVGRIKENALIGTALGLLFFLPATYLLFKFGLKPYIALYISIFNAFLFSFVIKPYLLYKIAGMKVHDYFKKVIVPVLKVTVVAIIAPIMIVLKYNDSIFRFLCVGLLSALSVCISALFLGMDKGTRNKILNAGLIKIKIFKTQ